MDKKPAMLTKTLIVKKSALKILNQSLKSHTVVPAENYYKTDVLYDTTDKYFLKGEYQRLLLVNSFNLLTRQSRAVAKYFTNDGAVIEKTSDSVTELLGHEQYKTIFTALCSNLDQELKIRSILSLLTLKSDDKKVTVKSESDTTQDSKIDVKIIKTFTESCSQTDEIRVEKHKPRKRLRKPISPYIIQDADVDAHTLNTKRRGTKALPRKIVVKVTPTNPDTEGKATVLNQMPLKNETQLIPTYYPTNPSQAQNLPILTDNSKNISSDTNLDSNTETLNLDSKNFTFIDAFRDSAGIKESSKESTTSLTDLGFLHDEYSNGSTGHLSVLSETTTNPELLTNPTSFLNNIDQHTKEIQPLYTVPGTDILVPFKPEDMFHIATKDNLRYSDAATRQKLLKCQLSYDMKNCLTIMDEYGNLPIHLAVKNNDPELLVRQCIVLKLQGYTVDVDEGGPTPLKLAVESGNGQLVAILLRHGACPLRTDDEHRACTHDAAEKNADVLSAVLTVCKENARKILYENEDLWKPEMETQSDVELAKYLLNYMCSMFNKQGYNPLMLASALGLYENVRVLLEHSASVDDQMPTCGNTALYNAVAAACNSSIELGNKSKVVDHFRKTIELLLSHGADPNIENNSGSSVHSLLQEASNQELSQLVANRQYQRLPDNKNNADNKTMPIEKDIAKVMVVLGKEGEIIYKSIENEKYKKKPVNSKKPVLLDKDDARYKFLEKEMIKRKAKTAKNVNKKLVIIENVVLKPGDTSVTKPGDVSVSKPGDTSVSKPGDTSVSKLGVVCKPAASIVLKTGDVSPVFKPTETSATLKPVDTSFLLKPDTSAVKLGDTSVVKLGDTSVTKPNDTIDEKSIDKTNKKTVKVFQIQKNAAKKVYPAVKRKQSFEPSVIKQAKIDT